MRFQMKSLVTLTLSTFTAAALFAGGALTGVAATASATEHEAVRAFAGLDGPLLRLSRLATALDLTESQKDEIRAILKKHKAELVSEVVTEKTSRTALVDSIRQPVTDTAAVRNASAAVARADADLAVTRATIYAEVYSVLTPAQRDTLHAALTEWRTEIGRRVDAALNLFGHAL